MQSLVIRTNSTEVMQIDTGGQVGIGTATPQNLLHVGPGACAVVQSRVNAVVASKRARCRYRDRAEQRCQPARAGIRRGRIHRHHVEPPPRLEDRGSRPGGRQCRRQVLGIAANPQNLLHVGPGVSAIVQSRVNAVVASNAPDAGIAIAQNSGVNVLVQASGAGAFIGTTAITPWCSEPPISTAW